jgi:hypothetical protein
MPNAKAFSFPRLAPKSVFNACQIAQGTKKCSTLMCKTPYSVKKRLSMSHLVPQPAAGRFLLLRNHVFHRMRPLASPVRTLSSPFSPRPGAQLPGSIVEAAHGDRFQPVGRLSALKDAMENGSVRCPSCIRRGPAEEAHAVGRCTPLYP